MEVTFLVLAAIHAATAVACAFFVPTRAGMASLYGIVSNLILLAYYGAPVSPHRPRGTSRGPPHDTTMTRPQARRSRPSARWSSSQAERALHSRDGQSASLGGGGGGWAESLSASVELMNEGRHACHGCRCQGPRYLRGPERVPESTCTLQVLKDRSAASIYFPTVAANGLNGAFWSVYALAIKDGWPRCWTTRCASKHFFSQAPPTNHEGGSASVESLESIE